MSADWYFGVEMEVTAEDVFVPDDELADQDRWDEEEYPADAEDEEEEAEE